MQTNITTNTVIPLRYKIYFLNLYKHFIKEYQFKTVRKYACSIACFTLLDI